MFAILCHNPTAGAGNHSKKELLAALELAEVEAEYCSTKGDDFPEMLKQPIELIISAGGDGTVAKVIKCARSRRADSDPSARDGQ